MLRSSSNLTPLNCYVWSHFLHLFPHEEAAWVLHGLEFGFDIGCSGGSPTPSRRNCRSAYLKPQIIDNYLTEELKYGSIAGPFESSPIKNLQINRFGVIPKSTPGKWRLVKLGIHCGFKCVKVRLSAFKNLG